MNNDAIKEIDAALGIIKKNYLSGSLIEKIEGHLIAARKSLVSAGESEEMVRLESVDGCYALICPRGKVDALRLKYSGVKFK